MHLRSFGFLGVISFVLIGSVSYGQQAHASGPANAAVTSAGGLEQAVVRYLNRDFAISIPTLSKFADDGDVFAEFLLLMRAWDVNAACEAGGLRLAKSLADHGLRVGFDQMATCEDPPEIETIRLNAGNHAAALKWRHLGRQAMPTPKARTDLEKGFGIIQRRAEAGNGLAQYYCYTMGRSLRLLTEPDAQVWLQKAAVSGVPEAEYALSTYYALGNQYMGGPGHREDVILKLTWLRKAADHKLASAQIQLGDVYSISTAGYGGLGQNVQESGRWYRQVLQNPGASTAERTSAQKNLKALDRTAKSESAGGEPAKKATRVDTLVAAVRSGDVHSVEEQLPGVGQINGVSSEFPRQTALQAAAAGGNIAIVKTLVEKGADVKAEGDFGDTVLHSVAGDPEIVRFLVARGATPNAKDFGGGTPLHAQAVSTQNNPVEIIRSLIVAGADVNAKDDSGETPLIRALKTVVTCESGTGVLGVLPNVDALVSAKADPSDKDNWGNSAFSLAQDLQKNCKRPWASQEESDAANGAVASLVRVLGRATPPR